jgi:nicotinamidase-related amidase
MQQAFGMTVPVTPSEMCHPSRAALLVYDAQVGILPAVQEREAVTDRMTAVLGAVRAAGMPVLYTRHVSLPPFLMGVGALRTAMAWQRVASADQVRQPFPPNGPQTQLVPELGPDGGEPVLDKLGMSAFVGTPLRWCCAIGVSRRSSWSARSWRSGSSRRPGTRPISVSCR